MAPRCGLFCIFLVLCMAMPAQDTLYARQVLKFLCSEKCYGRGYLKNGQQIAADYIAAELKKEKIPALFPGGYFQPFRFSVNTFPNKVFVKLNGRVLKPGADYILNPESGGLSGKFKLQKKDSLTYTNLPGSPAISVVLKKKLTFSVALEASKTCGIQLLNKDPGLQPTDIELNVQNKLVEDFQSDNVCAYFNGTKNNDSMIVFSAHYDHLGGMGKKTFFPGANDNASGVSVLLNLVRYYKKYPPAYKTVFLFFAGEEAGLLGSRYFVQNNAIDLKKIKFLLNLDLLGTGDDGIMVVNGAIHEKQFVLLQQINSEKNLVKEIKKRGKAQNSDHFWFTEAGVPCFFIYTLGGVTSYHDIYDIAATLPLTDYSDVFRLLVDFVDRL